MMAEIDKYNKLSEIFSKLSNESQEKLVEIAHQLLYIHQSFCKQTNYTKEETTKNR